MRHGTMRSRGTIFCGTAALVASILVLGAVGGPASAAPFEPVLGGTAVDASTTVQVKGTIVVYSGQAKFGDSDRAEPLPDTVQLRTETGQAVTITGPLTEGIVSGSDFEGTLSVPAELAPSVNAAVEAAVTEAAPLHAETDLESEILTASADLSAPLTVVEATITAPELDAALPAKVHSVDIAVLALPNASNAAQNFPLTNAGVDTLVQTLSTYWASQSAGQVASIVKPQAVRRIVTASACDAIGAWNVSATAFGDPHGNTYYTASGAKHLLVIAPAACGAGTGLGSVGTLTSGGVAWGSYDNTVGTSTMAHEFGHNLGLNHSNVHYCTGATVEGTPQADSDGCADNEYMDAYDVMGASFTFNGATNAQLTALNVTQKSRLGALNSTDLPTMKRTATLGSMRKTVQLNPISATSGLRGLRVIDPTTNGEYFVEYRSGTGIDTGALYTEHYHESLAPGVRVLRIRGDGSSAVLSIPNPNSTDPIDRHLFLTTGESLRLPSGNLTVSVGTVGATAAVTITLGTGPVTPSVDRISGSDRYSTAVAISQAGYPTTARVVYLATGENYPDALSAAPAAAAHGGPLLLTVPTELPDSVRDEIIRLKPTDIVVVGGTQAVSASVFNKLKPLATTVTRIAGADRFETGRKIVAAAFQGTVASAYIATGLNYPDALSASAAAGSVGIPVVLVNGAAGSVDAATIALLKKLNVSSVTVVGGTQAVSSGISTGLTTIAPVTRISGVDRFDTSQKITKAAFKSVAHAYLATGYQFPDALAGAALAGSRQSPLYVVPTGCIPAAVRADLTAFKTTAVTLLGGPNALSPAVAELRGC